MMIKKNIKRKLSIYPKVLGVCLFLFFPSLSFSQNAATLDWVKSTRGSGSDISQQSRGLVHDNEDNFYEYGAYLDSVNFASENQADYYLNTPDNSSGYYIAKYTNQGNLVWANSISATIFSMEMEGDDSFIIAGTYSDSVDMDFSVNEYFLHANTNNDGFLAKYDKDANLIWAISTSSNSAILFQNIAVCSATQRVYVAGVFSNTVDFNPDPNESYELNTGSWLVPHAFIASYSLEGEFLWVHDFNVQNVIGLDQIYHVNCDNNGNFYFTGHFADTVQLDPLGIVDPIISLSNEWEEHDVFLAKYDSDYNLQWISLMQGISRNMVRATKATENYIYLTGHTNKDMTVYSSDKEDSVYFEYNIKPRPYLVKYNLDGEIEWGFDLEVSDNSWGGTNIVKTDNSGCYVIGSFGGSEPLDFNPDSNNQHLMTNNSTHQECFLAKYTNEGDFAWAFSTPGGILSEPRGLTVLNDGRVVVTGIFRGTVDVSGYGTGGSITTDFSPSINNFSFTAVYQQGMLSTNEIVNNGGISLYPNPATDLHTIKLEGFANQKVFITLYDIQGRSLGTVYDGKLLENSLLEFDVSHLSFGLYLYDVRLETERQTVRFLKY